MDYSKWANIGDDDEEHRVALQEAQQEEDPNMCPQAYMDEIDQETSADTLRDLKIQMAMDAYEQRRPTDKVMHHYWVKDAGDPDAIGEYYKTGDYRNGCPVYKNDNDILLSREVQPVDDDGDECYGWIFGSIKDRRPLYGVMTEDVSVPTLGWQVFTALAPPPTLRYYTNASAAKVFKDRGNAAFQKKDWDVAEKWYTRAVDCKMDVREYAEPCAMILSNRAEVRLRLSAFDGALADTEESLRYLRILKITTPSTFLLKQKTVVRRVKSLRALKRFGEASKVIGEALKLYPDNQDLARLNEETLLLQKAQPAFGISKVSSENKGKGATQEILCKMSQLVEFTQSEVVTLGDTVAEFAFPRHLAVVLNQMDYMLGKAKSVVGGCLQDLQTLLRSSGCLNTLLQIVEAQWVGRLEGQLVDTYKHQALSSVVAIISLACDGNYVNLKQTSQEMHAFCSALGGCNRKVDTAVCERLIPLVAWIWEHCRAKALEAVKTHSIVIEKAASFLSKVLIALPADETGGPDAPALSDEAKTLASNLLIEWISSGGRVATRALRGMVTQVVDETGMGFFFADEIRVRELACTVLLKVIHEPALLSPFEVKNMLTAIGVLVRSFDQVPGQEAITVFEGYDYDGHITNYIDLEGSEDTEIGKHMSILAKAVAASLEYRLVLKSHELEKDAFLNAFIEAHGYFMMIPFIQGPKCFAEPALQCLATVAQVSQNCADTLIRLGGFVAALDILTPPYKPFPSCLLKVYADSPLARKHGAKIMAKCGNTEVTADIMNGVHAEEVLKLIVRLLQSFQRDSQTSQKSIEDLLSILAVIAHCSPELCCRSLPLQMVHFLAGISYRVYAVTSGDSQERYAQDIMSCFTKHPKCKKIVAPILERVGKGVSLDSQDEVEYGLNLIPEMDRTD